MWIECFQVHIDQFSFGKLIFAWFITIQQFNACHWYELNPWKYLRSVHLNAVNTRFSSIFIQQFEWTRLLYMHSLNFTIWEWWNCDWFIKFSFRVYSSKCVASMKRTQPLQSKLMAKSMQQRKKLISILNIKQTDGIDSINVETHTNAIFHWAFIYALFCVLARFDT